MSILLASSLTLLLGVLPYGAAINDLNPILTPDFTHTDPEDSAHQKIPWPFSIDLDSTITRIDITHRRLAHVVALTGAASTGLPRRWIWPIGLDPPRSWSSFGTYVKADVPTAREQGGTVHLPWDLPMICRIICMTWVYVYLLT